MAKIKVHPKHGGAGLVSAIERANSGDTILLRPGRYDITTPMAIQNLTITGLGDPSEVVVTGTFRVQGILNVSNLQISPLPYDNAFMLQNEDAYLRLKDVLVSEEPAGKYPAVWVNQGTVVAEGVRVTNARDDAQIFLREGARLHLSGSSVGQIYAQERVIADIISSSVRIILASERSIIRSFETLNMRPIEGKRLIAATGESSAFIPLLFVDGVSGEIFCQDSVLEIEAVRLSEGDSLRALVDEGGHVISSDPSIQIAPANVDEPRSTGPQTHIWPLADAENFAAIEPELRPGDSLQLEAGDYYLDESGMTTLRGISILGQGRGRSFLHGGIRISENTSAAITNLSLLPGPQQNGIDLRPGAVVSVENCEVGVGPGTSYPTLYLAEGSQLSLTNVLLEAAQDDARRGIVVVEPAACLQAVDTSLGWCEMEGESHLEDCSVLQLQVTGGGSVTSKNQLEILPNGAALRPLVIAEEAKVVIEGLVTTAEMTEAYVDTASLTLDEWRAEGTLEIYHDSMTSEVSVGDAEGVFLIDTAQQSEPGSEVASEGVGAAPKIGDESAASLEDEGPKAPFAAGVGDPLAAIQQLTGLERVKEQIRAFVNMVEFNQRRQAKGLKATGVTMHSVFLGNPGTGKTTVARLLGQALFQAGAISENVFVEVSRKDLVADVIGGSAKKTAAVLESARGGVLFVDEAYALYQEGSNNGFAEEALAEILKFMENYRDEIVVIFAGYRGKMEEFFSLNEGLKSRVPNRFDFDDYSSDEIATIGIRELERDDYTVNVDLYRQVVKKAYGQSEDHSNARWVRNFNQDLIQIMSRRVTGDPSHSLEEILDEDLYELSGGDQEDKHERIQNLLRHLDEMVGLAEVKEWVKGLVARAKFDQRMLETGHATQGATYHMVFSGNPGTGKTTVARLVGELFYNLGILKTPTVKTVDRSDLVGAWVGHTERNTTRAVEESIGGVLFIDEAYQLSNSASQNDFGQQAIETLITRLEEDRDRFVAIFAGYTEEMTEFLNVNPGLRSRIPEHIEFPDYAPAEIGEIVVSMLRDRDWSFDQVFVRDQVEEKYAATPSVDRGNARWARNYVEALERGHIAYVMENEIPDDELRLMANDVVARVAL